MRSLAVSILFVSIVASAHDSPEHEIEAINERMTVSGTNATLLARRATEWRALHKLDKAQVDLTHAVALEPHSLALRVELASVQGLQQRYDAALSTLDAAFAIAKDDAQRGTIWIRRAEIHEAGGQSTPALEACEKAFRLCSPELDWYITRARLLARAGRWTDSARGLREGFERTGSIVLETEWIDALLDAGRCPQAHDRIQPHLEKSRWKASWLIRQARVELCLGNGAAARDALRKALDELNRRSDPSKPDGWLLLDRALAHALLGEKQTAETHLQIARESLGSMAQFASATHRLDRILTEMPAFSPIKNPVK